MTRPNKDIRRFFAKKTKRDDELLSGVVHGATIQELEDEGVFTKQKRVKVENLNGEMNENNVLSRTSDNLLALNF